MSADNGIYIAQFNDGFRVIHAQAIENIFYHPEGSKQRKKDIADYFEGAKVFSTPEEANVEAKNMEGEILKDEFCTYIEYGISNIGFLEDFKT